MRKVATFTCLLVLLMIWLLFGCSKKSNPSAEGISEQEAIDLAVKSAAMARVEMSGSQVTPTNVHAERMILVNAIKRIDENDSVAAGESPDMPVWFVEMDGIWLDEFPRLADTPTPEPYRHLFIIMDAKSGLEIETAASH